MEVVTSAVPALRKINELYEELKREVKGEDSEYMNVNENKVVLMKLESYFGEEKLKSLAPVQNFNWTEQQK